MKYYLVISLLTLLSSVFLEKLIVVIYSKNLTYCEIRTFKILLTIAPNGTIPEAHESTTQDSLNLPADLRLGLVMCFRFPD